MILDDRTGSGRWMGPALYPKPNVEEVAACLQTCAPELAGAPVEFLAEGWEFWAFSAGDHVIRAPKTETGSAVLAMDRRLLPELSRHLKTPVPIVDVHCDDGPNGQPLAVHHRLPGVLLDAKHKISPTFGRELGELIRELHGFPVQKALALGVPLRDGPTLRQRRLLHYEDVRQRAFPFLGPDLRRYVEATFEAYLNEPANFDFEPCLLHQDLDSNILIYPETGSISGLIDFSAVVVSNPAIDFWLPLAGFALLGIESQLSDCLEAAGITDTDVLHMLPEVNFWTVRYSLFGILHGLDIADEAYVAESIQELGKLAEKTEQ